MRREGTALKTLRPDRVEAESNQSGSSECVHCNERKGMKRAAHTPHVSSVEGRNDEMDPSCVPFDQNLLNHG